MGALLPPPALPGFAMTPPAAAPVGVPDIINDAWQSSQFAAQLLSQLEWARGRVMQIVTLDDHGAVDGSCYFLLRGFYAHDALGRFCEAEFAGASHPLHGLQCEVAFNVMPGDRPILHVCSGRWDQCIAAAGHRPVIHINTFRLRPCESISDPWAKNVWALGGEPTPWAAGNGLGPGGVPVPAGAPAPGDGGAVDGADGGGAGFAGLGGDGGDLDHNGGDDDGDSDASLSTKELKLRRKLLALRCEPGAGTPTQIVAAQAALRDFDDRHGRRRRARRKRRSRSRGRRRSRSISQDSQDGQSPLFRSAPLRSGRAQLALIAEKHPGQLFNSTVARLNEFLGERGGATAKQSLTQWVTYLQSVVMQQARQADLPPERVQELRTLAEVLNHFGSGNLASAADLLAQRFKAVEQRALGRRETAVGLELVDANRAGLATEGELRITTRDQQNALHLRQGMAQLRRGS